MQSIPKKAASSVLAAPSTVAGEAKVEREVDNPKVVICQVFYVHTRKVKAKQNAAVAEAASLQSNS